MTKRKILIIGASGVLGQDICKQISYQKNILLYIGDYKPRRGQRTSNKWNAEGSVYINAEEEQSIRQAVRGFDAVVVSLKQTEPLIQKVCFDFEIPCIDVCTSLSFVKKIDNLNMPKTSPSVVMAGLFPGLSGVLINELKKQLDVITQVDVFFIQNIYTHLGKSGAEDMLETITTRLPHKKKAFANTRNVKIAGTDYELKQIEHGERQFLKNEFELRKINYWTGWNHKWFTRTMSLLIQTDFLPQVAPLLISHAGRKKTKDETAYLKVTAKGVLNVEKVEHSLLVKASSSYNITAKIIEMILHKFFTLPDSRLDELNSLTFPYEWIEFEDIESFLI